MQASTGRGPWQNNEPLCKRLGELVADIDTPFSLIARILSSEFSLAITRNAVIGKAGRMGFGVSPEKKRKMVGRNNRSEARKAKRRVGPTDKLFNVQWEDVIPVDDGAIPLGQRRTLIDLAEDTCRWPIGDPRSSDFFFCGGPSLPGLPYCAHHSRVAYQPRT